MIRGLVLVLVLGGVATAGGWAQQRGKAELSVGGLGYLTGPPYLGPVLGFGVPLMEELTAGATVTAGWNHHRFRGGGELFARLRLGSQRKKIRWYLAVGLGAGTARRGTGFLVGSLGVEAGRVRIARRRQGYWYLEAAAAGGVRLATGYRWLYRKPR